MIRILIDSSADYSAQEAKEHNLELVPINITINGKNYLDGVDITKDEFYEILTSTDEFPKTAQPSPQDYLDLFEDAKEKGDSIVYLSLSSALSGTFQSATLAKSMVEYDEIYLVDTLSATRAIRLMTEYACKLRTEGKDAATIASELEDFKSRVVILAAVDTLEYLSKGGRLNKAVAAVGELANLKPIITVTKEGSIRVPAKALGRNKAISTLVKMITEYDIDTTFPIYSLFAVGEENTEKLEQKLGKEGIRVTKRLQIGSTIGCHVGPGAYGVIFVTKK